MAKRIRLRGDDGPDQKNLGAFSAGMPLWNSQGGGGTLARGLDIFGSQPAPKDYELVQVFDDTVYSCVEMKAKNACKGATRLYQATANGEPTPKKFTRPITKKQMNRLAADPTHAGKLSQSKDVQEVTEHAILDLFTDPNPYLSMADISRLLSAYEDVVGAAYLLRHDENDKEGDDEREEDSGKPDQVWVLPSQYTRPEGLDRTFITHYVFQAGSQEKKYPKSRVIAFRQADLVEPYTSHYGPLRAAYERVKLSKAELSYFNQVLLNAGRPEIAFTSDIGAGMGTSERFTKQFDQKFRAPTGGAGGPIFLPPGVNPVQLAYSPADTYNAELFKWTKEQICNCFNTPAELLGQSSNYATYFGAMLRYYQDNIIPYLRRRDEILNRYLVSRFGDDRYFLATDEPVVEEDPQIVSQRKIAFSTAVTSVQEKYYTGTIPKAAAVANVQLLGLPDDEAEDLFPGEPTPKPTTPAFPVVTDSPKPVEATKPALDPLAVSKAVAELQTSYYGGGLPREAAAANAMLLGLSPHEAAALFPEKEPEPTPPQPDPVPDPQPAPEAGTKALHQPEYEDELRRTIADFFRDQAGKALDKLAADPNNLDWLDAGAMTERVYPYIALIADQQAKGFLVQFGVGSEDVWRVVQPKLKEAVGLWVGELCESTKATTNLDINTAITQLRATVAEGAERGEVLNATAAKVRDIFTSASVQKSFEIARTETARMQNRAVRIVGDELDVVEGYEWVASTRDTCDLCRHLNGKRVTKGQPFDDGEGPYGQKWGGDGHPNCRCYVKTLLKGVE